MAGLNCGRWDYIYSFIKKFAEDLNCVMPDRGQVTMTAHFLRSYSLSSVRSSNDGVGHYRLAFSDRR